MDNIKNASDLIYANMTPDELREQVIHQNGLDYRFHQAVKFYDRWFDPIYFRFDFKHPDRDVPLMEYEFVPRDGLSPRIAGQTVVCTSEEVVLES